MLLNKRLQYAAVAVIFLGCMSYDDDEKWVRTRFPIPMLQIYIKKKLCCRILPNILKDEFVIVFIALSTKYN